MLLKQGFALLEMLEIPACLRTETNARAIYLLLCHTKVSLRLNTIRSEYTALLKGVLANIKQSYYSIFYTTFKKARAQFFHQELIQILWLRF